MLSRALTLATMIGFIGYCAIAPAQAQENLEAGKDAAQIYTDACSVCHKSTHGLLKTVARGSLAGFLKEHYTTSPAMASLLANYLLSHGADDARFGVGPRQGGAKQATRSESRPANPIERLFDSFGHRRNAAPREATAPASQPQQGPKADAKPGERETAAHHKRQARWSETGDTAKLKEHAASGEPVNAHRREEGRKVAAKQHAHRHPKPDLGEAPKGTVREEPKPKEASNKTEASKSEAAKEERGTESPKGDAGRHETAKVDDGKKPDAKPVSGAPAQSANAEPPKQDGKESKARPALRSGSVPPVTTPPAAAATSPAAGGEPAAVSAAAPPPPPPATTASVPPAGRPGPPVSH
jgi:hypothetical protein